MLIARQCESTTKHDHHEWPPANPQYWCKGRKADA